MASPEGLRTIEGAMSFKAGDRKYLPDGGVLSAVAKPDRRKGLNKKTNPSNTALHEATHAVVAAENGTPVENGTVIPGPGYLGLTKLGRPDPIAAVAPHADGMSGTSHDVKITNMMGHDESSLAGTARSIMNKNRAKIIKLANFLDGNKSATGSDVENIRRQVDNREKNEQNTDGIEITIKRPSGEVVVFERTRDGKILIPNNWQM